jgi:hypothetical protein
MTTTLGLGLLGLVMLALALMSPLIGSLGAREAAGWLPYLSAALVERASRKLPENQRERWRKEWQADLSQFQDRPLTQLTHALFTARGAASLSRELGAKGSTKRLTLSAIWDVAGRVFVDLSAITLGIYAALLPSQLLANGLAVDWTHMWRTETAWLPAVALLAILVLWWGGFYAPRERRGTLFRTAFSLLVVAVISLGIGITLGYAFADLAIVPLALIPTIVLLTTLRKSYYILAEEAIRLRGVLAHQRHRGDSA